MKKLLVLTIFCFCCISVPAQHRVTGSIVNNDGGDTISFATVALLRSDSTIVTATTTNDTGNFLMENIPTGSYILLVSFIGYEKLHKDISIPEQCEVGECRLKESAHSIADVVVTGNRPFIEQKADRYVVNVGNHILTAGRNAVDVLSNTPGVMVSDGSISVMGKGVEIYIDGRPSRLSGEQLIALLSSIQGDNVNKIEVVTNPSSRYDAAGLGGIIDIRTKKGIQHGLNGSIDVGYRQGRKDAGNAGISLNYRRKDFNIFGNYSINRSNNWTKLNQLNGTENDGTTHIFDQNAIKESQKAAIGQQYRIGIDYYINDNNIIGVLFNGYHTGKGKNRLDGFTTISPPLDGVAGSSIMSETKNDNDGKQYNLNYQGLFAKPGQQLNIDLDYGRFKSGQSQFSDVDYFDPNELLIAEKSELLRHTNPQDIEVWSAKADYSHPLWINARMELGAKSSRASTDNNLLHEEYDGSVWQMDPDRTNNFIYREDIHAGYLNINQNLGKVNLQAGLRGEYTESKGDQRTTGDVNRKSYFDLFPTFYINYGLSEKHHIGASYGRRIMRPMYGQLNPFELKLDAYSFESGNPDLKPSYIDNISFSYSYTQNLMVRISYNNMKDIITQMPVNEEGRYGITRTNFGKRESLTAMLNYRVAPAKFWNINLMIVGMYSHDKSMESFGEIDQDAFAATTQINNNFTITRTLSAELTGVYTTKQRHTYMEMKPYGNVSLGIRKTFFDNKFSVSIAANDVFNTFKTNVKSVTENLHYKMKVQGDSRYVNLSVRYNFGMGNAKAARNHTSGIEEEKNRAK